MTKKLQRIGFACKWIDFPRQVDGISAKDDAKQYNTGGTTVAWLGRQEKTVAEQKRKLGFVVKVFETFVTRKNLLTGKEYLERYDTPSFCSPSSESYWSM